MKIKTIFHLAVTSLLLSSVSLANEPLKKQKNPITFGSLTALTGYSAKQGVVCKKAFEIAHKEYSNKKTQSREINLSVGDSQRKATPALSEYSRMTATQPIYAFALSGSPVGMGINPFSKRDEIPIIGAVGHKDFLAQNDYAFAFWPSTGAEGAAIAEKILSDNKTRIAIISAEDDWTLSLRDGLVSRLKTEFHVKTVFNEEVSREETDFATTVLKLRSKNPDAIFVNVVLGNSGILIKKIRELGIRATIYANYFAGTEAELSTAGEAANGVIGAKVDYDINALKELFVKDGMPEADPNTIAFTCYASMRFLLDSVASNPKVGSAKELYQHMLENSSVEVLGETLEVKDRRAQFKFRYEEFRNGAWKQMN